MSDQETEHVAFMRESDVSMLKRLGVEVDVATDGHSVCRMTVGDDMVNSAKFCHGGFVFALADTALAYAYNSLAPHSVTLSASITYSGAARVGDELVAVGTVNAKRKSTGSCVVEVKNQDGDLLATMLGSAYTRTK